MSLRGRKMPLRHSRFSKAETFRYDVSKMASEDGDMIVFEWIERENAVWNPIYETYEGGTTRKITLEQKGFGKVVDFKEDEMEYEWGRVAVGECLIRFPFDFDIESLKDKEHLRFFYKGQRWKPDSPLGIGDWIENTQCSKILKGVKSVD